MRSLVYVLASLALFASEAQAQDIRRIGELGRNRSASAVAHLLEQAGCHRLWVSKALEDSKAVLKQGNVILDTPACEPAPPPEVARHSQQLLNPAVVRKTAAPRVPALSESFAPKVAELETEVANLRTRNGVLETANKELEKKSSDAALTITSRDSEIATLKQAPLLDDGERNRIAFNWFLYGVVATLLLAGLVWLIRSRKDSTKLEQHIDTRGGTRTLGSS